MWFYKKHTSKRINQNQQSTYPIGQINKYNQLMQNQNNALSTIQTSRLQRMNRIGGSTRRSSISHFDNKDNFKLAAINSIRRGIKDNDISIITKEDIRGTAQQAGNTLDIAAFRTQESFEKVRKEFDALLKDKIQTEKLLSKLKQQVENSKAQEQMYSDKKNGASKRVQQLEAHLQQKKLLLQDSVINTRLREDKIISKEKKFNLQNLLSQMKKQYTIINREEVSKEQQVHKGSNIKLALQKQIEQETQKRQQHLRSLQAQIAMLRQTVQIDEARQREIKQIRERANQDKSEDEKQWRNLLQTHYFVSHFLTNKMDRQMQKFKVVETAFKNIKIATGVSDVQSLVSKYLNRESVYGKLLDNIAQKQKTIEEFKKIRISLENQFKDQNNSHQLVQPKKVSALTNQLKSLDIAVEKKLKSQLQKNKFGLWIKRQIKKIQKIQGSADPKQQEEDTPNTIQTTKNNLTKFISWLQKQVVQLSSPYLQVPHEIGAGIQFEAKNLMRVRSEESDQEQHTYLHVADTNYLNNERDQLLRENQKFMSDLKKKKEQEQKLQIEISLMKKVSTSPVKKQKEQID